MKVHIKKFTSIILAVALVVSMMVVPAGAADDGYDYNPQASSWQSFYSAMADALTKSHPQVNIFFELLDDLSLPHVGLCSYEELLECERYYNKNYVAVLARAIDQNLSSGVLTYAVLTDTDDGVLRLCDATTGEWIVNKDGEYPYCFFEGDASDETFESIYSGSNQWIPISQVGTKTEPMSKSVLDERCLELNDDCHPCRVVETIKFGGIKYYVIQDYSTDDGENCVYCNSQGYAYVAIAEPSATNNKYDIVDNSNNVVADNAQVVDINNGKLNLYDENGIVVSMDIANMVYDTSSPSYTINAYTTVNEGDNYYYTYYTYNVTYNITNTYVTYIGSNDAYEKEEYEYYYQLPDGRSSADLTADEVAGMSFEFHDVVNYARSATDVSVRALYHFDGNTDDSSYFSTQGHFDWNEGASITYMEAPSAFDGALYLDNTAHSFDVVLPFSMSMSDYTIQFRYYQASEPDTQDNIDNYIEIGGTKVLCWDEKTVSRDPSGQHAAWSLPVGTWNEIALVRHDGKLYVYLNGLCVSSETYFVAWRDTITFNFGSGSRAYSMIDELRVLDFAITEGGVSYTPTAVPHDSNLVLVLPDSDRPVADEYYEVSSSKRNLMGDYYNFFNGGNLARFSTIAVDSNYPWLSNPPVFWQGFGYRTEAFSASAESDCLFLTHHSQPTYNFTASESINCFNWGFGFYIGPESLGHGIKSNTDYTFSIVHSDGNIDSFTFNTGSTYMANGYCRLAGWNSHLIDCEEFSWGKLCYWAIPFGYDNAGYFYKPVVSITPNVGSTVDVSYIEFVEGVSDLAVEKKTAVYEGDTIQPNTAAVQSEIPVNGYTVGGVRPTLPAKGDCWFPVQEGRIQTCYIYTGSMWEEVGCRWYTGSRWIPIYAFDLTTLEDLFDIADSADVIVPIPNESGFWRWWQLQWLDFREWLETTLSKGGGSGSGSVAVPDDPASTLLPGVSDSVGEDGEPNEDGWSFLDLLVTVKDGVWSITKGIVVTGAGGIVGLVNLIGDAGDFFDVYEQTGPDSIFGAMTYEGEDIWD